MLTEHQDTGSPPDSPSSDIPHRTPAFCIAFWLLSKLCPLALANHLTSFYLPLQNRIIQETTLKIDQWMTAILVIKMQSSSWVFSIHITSELAGAEKEGMVTQAEPALYAGKEEKKH